MLQEIFWKISKHVPFSLNVFKKKLYKWIYVIISRYNEALKAKKDRESKSKASTGAKGPKYNATPAQVKEFVLVLYSWTKNICSFDDLDWSLKIFKVSDIEFFKFIVKLRNYFIVI